MLSHRSVVPGRWSRRRNLAALGFTICFAIGPGVAVGCGSDDGSSAASGDNAPIKIGAVSTMTGFAPYPEGAQVARAYFNRINRNGGINGRQIEYLIEDDKASTATAAQVARRLIQQEEVVAMAGGISSVACGATAPLYERFGVLSVEYGLPDPCFTSPNIASISGGARLVFQNGLTYLAKERNLDRLCFTMPSATGFVSFFKSLVKDWEQKAGRKLNFFDQSTTYGEDQAPAMVNLKRGDCDAVQFGSDAPQVPTIIKQAKQQGVYDVPWIMSTNVLETSVAKELAAQDAAGLLVVTDMEPFTSGAPALKDYLALTKEANIPPSGRGIAGYVVAQIMERALKSVKGDYTRESVSEALHAQTGFKTPLLGEPFNFEKGKPHPPYRTYKVAQSNSDGSFTSLTPEWLVGL